jgi:hypothetical protein
VGTYDDGNGEILTGLLSATHVIPRVLATVEAGSQLARSFHLKADECQIPHAGVRIACRNHAGRDIRAAILLEVARDREPRQIGDFSFPEHIMYWPR